jgi:hypothetical protein
MADIPKRVLLSGANEGRKEKIKCLVTNIELDQPARQTPCYLYKISRVANIASNPDLRHFNAALLITGWDEKKRAAEDFPSAAFFIG